MNKFSVWIEQTIVRAVVVVVEADDTDHAKELAAMAAEDGRPWPHVEVTNQRMEVRPAVKDPAAFLE